MDVIHSSDFCIDVSSISYNGNQLVCPPRLDIVWKDLEAFNDDYVMSLFNCGSAGQAWDTERGTA